MRILFWFFIISAALGGAFFLADALQRTPPRDFTQAVGVLLQDSVPLNTRGSSQEKIAALSSEEKIGQMLMVAIPEGPLSDETAEWLRIHHIGGIILLGGNVKSEAQVRELIADLQKTARNPGDPPLFIAGDQEGGRVSRFHFLNELTPQRSVRDEYQAFLVGKARGTELRGLGVNVNFSPVLDVSEEPGEFMYARTFAGDSEQVTKLGIAMVRGYQKSGMVAVAKHFPGHGETPVDSHRTLPMLNRNDRAWEDHVLPFRTVIREGVEMIMVGHLKFPHIDPLYPASLSPFFVDEVLREELKYRGVIITDDLAMGAVADSFTLSDAAVQAVRAGADIVLAVKDRQDYNAVYTGLVRAVEQGEISQERINKSVIRILALKGKF
ncbi:MAG: beta-N-acetylhexosaminidase [Parcubacteria group bacterium Gr01-1014_33]|nr:MAG: beta-N-acetylhexosaminidase [Parcubacteria group bacterium Gr01-1014_33]